MDSTNQKEGCQALNIIADAIKQGFDVLNDKDHAYSYAADGKTVVAVPITKELKEYYEQQGRWYTKYGSGVPFLSYDQWMSKGQPVV